MSVDRTQPTVIISRKAIHDLMNHLCVAMGNSELLLMDLTAEGAQHAAATEIRDACTSAIALARSWSEPEGPSR